MPTFELTKSDGQRFVIGYDEGDEGAVLDALIAMAGDPALTFDWFDAALISHRLGKNIVAGLKPLKPLPTTTTTKEGPTDANG